MKILFITNFYSGIQNSILNNKWNPEGMPAVYKLFEKLKEKKIYFDNIYFSDKHPNMMIRNDYLSNKNYIFQSKKGRLIPNIYSQLLKFLKIILYVKHYDIIYIDRANVIIGALLTILGRKVILRLHGVNSYFENYKSIFKSCLNIFNILSYRASFESIICTEDGTPGTYFLKKYCNKNSKIYLMLNGVDKVKIRSEINKEALNINQDQLIVTFIGRLDNEKGIWDFIYSIEKLSPKNMITGLIIGDGLLMKTISSYVKKTKIKNIIFIGAVNHKDINSYLSISDIFISLNRLGNLCNTTLEAIGSEKCIITLNKNTKTFRDYSTHYFLKDSVIYINRNNVVQELSKVLLLLSNNKQLIEIMRQRVIKTKLKLPSWDYRIEKEMKIIISL
jgi:glycosyltransferase involved in cell wall biosynthesis